LDEKKLSELLQADFKRKRGDYDSYHLALERKNSVSEPWSDLDIYAQDVKLKLRGEKNL